VTLSVAVVVVVLLSLGRYDKDDNNDDHSDNDNVFYKRSNDDDIMIVTSTNTTKNTEDSSIDHPKHQNSPTVPYPIIILPSHVNREIYKQERRKNASIRFMALKKPLYDNIEMYGPDNVTLLCTIGKKKAHWYVHKKKLAVWRTPLLLDDGGNNNHDAILPTSKPPSIRLLFTPKNNNKPQQLAMNKEELNHRRKMVRTENSCSVFQPTSQQQLYNTSHKRNICVACGTTTGLMRHYVVPYAYRRLLPSKLSYLCQSSRDGTRKRCI
jgi:hypothetical protein